MLTVTSRRLLQAACQQARTIAASAQLLEEAAKSSKEALLSSWSDPNLDPPKFASDFLPQRDPAPAAIPEKLTVNFYMPHGVIMSGEKVDLAVFPAANGEMGVKPGHVSTIAELKPGLVTIHKEEDKQVEKYFVSSGFAFVYDDSVTDICAVEAVPLSDIDPAAVQSGLEEANAQLASAQTRGDDLGAAQAQIGVEVYTAMGAALTR